MKDVSSIRESFRRKLEFKEFVQDKSGVKTLEIVGASFLANQSTIFGEVNKDYCQRELEWYKSQSRNVYDIPGKVPEIWKHVASPNGFINSNYGWCIWSKENVYQFAHCLNALLKDSNTRRAIMIYTRPTMQLDYNAGDMSDFMCTNTVQYLIRNDKLHSVVSMRSNDAIFGFKNDFFWQQYVQEELVKQYNANFPDKKIVAGDIHWQCASLHIYERHFPLVNGKYKTN